MNDDVLTLVRMANTIPDLADIDPREIEQSRVAIDEALRIERTPGMVGARIPRSQLRPALIAVAVAVLAALVIGIPALLSRGQEPTPIVDGPVPTTAPPVVTTTIPPTTTAAPETTAAPPTSTTTLPALPVVPITALPRIDLLQSERASVNGVVAGGPGVIAVGGTEVRPERPAVASAVFEGAIWVSTDGQSWTAVDGSGLFWLTEQQVDEGRSQ